jgi:hypothetical protein
VKYRTKPGLIEATQWFTNGDHPEDYTADREGIENGKLVTYAGTYCRDQQWEGKVVRYFRHPEVPDPAICKECDKPMLEHGYIDSAHGGHTVCPGDYVMTRGPNEYVPCKPWLFEQRYESAE